MLSRKIIVVLTCLLMTAGVASAAEIIRYDLNEGTGTVANDTASGGYNVYDATTVDGTNIAWGAGYVDFDGTVSLTTDVSPDSCWILGAGQGDYNVDLMDDCMLAWETRIRPNDWGQYYLGSGTHFWARFNPDSGIATAFSDEGYVCPELYGGGPPAGFVLGTDWLTIKASYDGRKLVPGREGVGEAKLWVDGELRHTVTFDTSGSAYPDGLRLTRAGCGTVLGLNTSGWSMGEYTGDMDYFVMWDVPEPATISLLAFGGLALLRRRKA